jgi:TolA-binding protein
MKKLLCSTLLALSLAVPTAAFAEPQPNMKEALEHLRAAKVSLEKATADKGGHRVKAIEHVNQAIEQVEKGIEFDNKH